MQVKVKKLYPDAQIPQYKTEGAVGFDFHATESFDLLPLEIIKVPLEGEELEKTQRKFVDVALSMLEEDHRDTMFSILGEEEVRNTILNQIPENFSKDMFVKYVPVVHPVIVGTGVAFEIPAGYELEVRGRSGLGIKHGIEVFNGTIDSDFRGEVKVKLQNTGDAPIHIKKGERIAQGVIKPIERVSFVEVDGLEETERGEGGFGSTGR